MRRSIRVFLALVIVSVPSAAAQQAKGIVIGANVGGTYYCIVSRCDTGTTVGVMAGVDVTPALAVEAAVRRHYCFDCDRFVIAETAAVLQYRRHLISPFVAAGVSYSSDPDFMGDHVGLLAATGAWVWPDRRWGMRLELRGRQVGRGDAVGELSLSLVHRFVQP